jgi:hypothetical protein
MKSLYNLFKKLGIWEKKYKKKFYFIFSGKILICAYFRPIKKRQTLNAKPNLF